MRSKMDSCHSTGCFPVIKSKPGLRPAQPFRCSLFQKSHIVVSGGVKIAPHTSPLRVFVMALASGSVPWLPEQPANWIHIRNWKGTPTRRDMKIYCPVYFSFTLPGWPGCLVLGPGPSVPAFLQSAVISSLHLLSHLQFDSSSCQLFTQNITWIPPKPVELVTWSAHKASTFSLHLQQPPWSPWFPPYGNTHSSLCLDFAFSVFSLGFNVSSSQRHIILLHIREIETDQQILPSPSLFLSHPSNRTLKEQCRQQSSDQLRFQGKYVAVIASAFKS